MTATVNAVPKDSLNGPSRRSGAMSWRAEPNCHDVFGVASRDDVGFGTPPYV